MSTPSKRKFFKSSLLIISVSCLTILMVLAFYLKKSSLRPKLNLIARPTIVATTPIATPETRPAREKNWISYKNNQYGFSLSYPDSWQLLDQPNVAGIEIQNIDKEGYGVSLSVRIVDNPQNLSLSEFSKSQVYSEDGRNETPETVKIGDLTGYKLKKLPPGLILEVYLPYKENKIFYVFAGGTTNPKGPNLSSYSPIILKMLNSLKL